VKTSEASATLYLVPQRVDRIPVSRRYAADLVSERPMDRTLALRGAHPDLIELVPPEKKERIGIDQIRDVIRQAQFTPVQGTRKVCTIPYAEALTVEAANALLKVLEEPPRGMAFVLLACHASDLLPTIVSRSRVLRVAPESDHEIVGRLCDAGYPAEQAKWLAGVPVRSRELEGLLTAPVDVSRTCREATAACREAATADLLSTALAGTALQRRVAVSEVLRRLTEADADLLTTGVRFLAARPRPEILLFLQDVLTICSSRMRRTDQAASEEPVETLDNVPLRRILAICRRIESAYRAMMVYGPMEGILFSTFAAFCGGTDGQ